MGILRKLRRRQVFEVHFREEPGVWVLIRRSSRRQVGEPYARKQDAIDAGAQRCECLEMLGGRAQLVIYNQDGQFGSERTYPDETPARKG